MSERFRQLVQETLDENYDDYVAMGSVDPKHD